MNPGRLQELLSAAADGTLPAREQAELDRLLEASPAARDEAERFRELEAFLSSVAEVDPPADLADRIVAGARLPGPSRPRRLDAWWRRFFTPAVLGYGLATAAGAVIAIALYETQPGWLDVPDISRLAGTLAPDNGERHAVLDTLMFEAGGISSIARLARRNGEIVLDVRIDADRPVRLDVDLGDPGLSVAALTQAPDSDQEIHIDGSRLSIDSQGRHLVVALLRGDTDAARNTELKLAFSSEGRTLKEGVLRIVN